VHRAGLAVHKNLRLAMLAGENFPNIIGDPKHERLRELYRRTLRYLLDGFRPLAATDNIAPNSPGPVAQIGWARPVRVEALRYELPGFIDFADPNWHRKPAPHAHYVIEGSLDGEKWFPIVDRRHGPWRGTQTDFFEPAEVRYIRFDGTFSSGDPFAVRQVEAFRAR
jgi:hypothetical protein